jgi:hypothetical protein
MVSVAMMLYTCIQDVLGSNLARDTNFYAEICDRIPQTFQENVGVVPRLDENRFLSNPFQLSYNSALYNLATDIVIK